MDRDTLDKLDYAYGIGCNNAEACLYAGISQSTLYRYLNNNPDYADHVELLKRRPVLKALIASDKLIDQGNDKHIRFVLERLKRDEYTLTHDVNITSESRLTIEDRQAALHDMLSSFKVSESASDQK